MESLSTFTSNGGSTSALGGGLLVGEGLLAGSAALEANTGLSALLRTLKAGVGKDPLSTELEHQLALNNSLGEHLDSTSASIMSTSPVPDKNLSSMSAASGTSPAGDSLTGMAETSLLPRNWGSALGAESIRVEAESMSDKTTYRNEANSSASQGQLIGFIGGASNETSTASTTFTGPSGNYNVVVGYYDEQDGQVKLEVKLGHTSLDSWVLDNNLGSVIADAKTKQERTVATGYLIKQGETIQIIGTENQSEHARVDYIDFIPVPAEFIRVEAESMTHKTTYRNEANSSASKGQLISLKGGASNETGTASATFTGPSGNYNVVVGYYDEQDGQAKLEVKLGHTSLDSWVLDKNLGSFIANTQTKQERTVATEHLIKQGETIQIIGTENQSEHARVDYIDFIPIGPQPTRIRINAGGPAQEVNGVHWSDSTGYVSGGFAHTQMLLPAISGVVSPANQAIYQSEWTGGQGTGMPVGSPAFTYNVPVSNGTYNVRLHFAELNKFAAGQRLFDVNIEGGAKELTNFDIFAQAGGAYKAIVRDFTTTINDGNVTIDFIRQVENAKISAIEIYPGSNPLPPPTSLFTWGSAAAPSPIGRAEAQGVMANGKLYVFGGFSGNDYSQATTRSDVYDPATNKWTQIADMPVALTHAPVVVDGQSIYVIGGYVGGHPGPSTNHVWKYSIPTNKWNAAPSLPEPIGGGGAAILGRQLHHFGGAIRTAGQTDDTDQNDHYVLSLDGGQGWSSLASLPNPRNHMAGATLNGKIYAIGGQHGHNEDSGNQTQVDVYDPSTNTWTQAADMPVPRGHISASTFPMNNRIFTIGGSVSGAKSSADVTTYDPQTNVWLKLPSLPEGRKTPVANFVGNQVIVTTGGTSGDFTDSTLTGVFANKWESTAAAPVSLGEVAGGIIGNKLYLVGEGNSATLDYNLSTGTWGSTSALATRPFVGNHHAAEVLNGKLYLFGGLGGADGKVQIYDPISNTWSLGANMPFAAGSSSSAVINGEVYLSGGIVGSTTTTQTAKYNPVTNTWTSLAPMKQGRNHAASATDGTKLYVFGGRGPGSGDGNYPTNGFDTVQVYDPATNTWSSSLDAGSTLAPLPEARGGMGKAVYFNNEFYVMGGETQNDPDANAQGVYNRVDIYNPHTNQWRLGTSMPTARHGIFPMLLAGRIHVAGGGVQAAHSSSSLFEIYNPG